MTNKVLQIQHTLGRGIAEKKCTSSLRYVPTNEARQIETHVIGSGGKELVRLTF
jgi:hypothetical protein